MLPVLSFCKVDTISLSNCLWLLDQSGDRGLEKQKEVTVRYAERLSCVDGSDVLLHIVHKYAPMCLQNTPKHV